MPANAAKQCSEEVARGNWDYGPCQNPATLLEEGKWWCGIHAPSKKKARDERMRAKSDVEAKLRERESARIGAVAELRRGVTPQTLIERDDALTREIEALKTKWKAL